jgi:hypothetical protein
MDYQREVTEQRAYQVYRIKQAVEVLNQALHCPILHNLPKTIEKATEMMEGRNFLVEVDAEVFVKDLMAKHAEELKPKMGRGKLALVSSKG